MAWQTEIKINGVDVLTTYGMYVNEIPDDSPIQDVRHEYLNSGRSPRVLARFSQLSPRKQSFSGHIIGTSHDDLQLKIENISALLGWYGSAYKDVILERFFFNLNGSLSGDSIIYRAVVTEFKIKYIEPIYQNISCNYTLTFDLLEYINPLGLTSQTFTPTLDPLSYGYFVFTDSNCLHGSSRNKLTLKMTGNSTVLDFSLLAQRAEFQTLLFSQEGLSSGSHPVVDGFAGNPAVNFTNEGSQWLKYTPTRLLGISGISEVSLFIRFKRTYSIGDTSIKYLFDAPTPDLALSIITGATSDIYLKKPGTDLSLSGANVSNTDWNVVIVTFSASGASLYLKTPSGLTSTTTASMSAFGSHDQYFWIGTQGGAFQGINIAKCHIAEVAIWKHSLSTDAVTALANSTIPVVDNFAYELNRRLTFYLNFSDGFNARANMPVYFGRTGGLNNQQLVVDSDLRTFQIQNLANLSSTNDAANIYGTSGLGFTFPFIEKYNKGYIISLAAGMQVKFDYMPLRRL